jgi:hypothetical protein
MGVAQQGMVFELLSKERILISYQGPHATQEQWDRYISLMQTISGASEMRFLVLVEGSPPSAANQLRIRALVKREWPVALVSSSIAMRFVVSAFSLVNRSIRFFSPEDLSGALVHIGCSRTEALAVHEALHRLQVED